VANVDARVRAYDRFVALPWDALLAGPQKVWFALYAPADERRLRARLGAFEVATAQAGHGWRGHDLTDAFAQWLAAHPYRDRFFRSPQFLTADALKGFDQFLADGLRATLTAPDVDAETVVAVWGVGTLFGLTRVSRLLEAVTGSVHGRLLVFFPGEREGSNYRLLDARDGWNYLATPIAAQEGDGA
jgi:hypothetical protein